MNKWLFRGKVYHERFSPKSYKFIHRIWFMVFPLSRLQELNIVVFSVDKFNLFSFQTRDHGDRKGGDLWTWALAQLSAAQVDSPITEIYLQTLPRILGYVFNPVSFWYCYKGERLVAVIAEVNNTFGGTHSYVLTDPHGQSEKVFHVSPFFQIEGSYRFQVRRDLERVSVSIDYHLRGQHMLATHVGGQGSQWSAGQLLKVFLAYPFYTFTVIAWIHVHALILYFKGLRFYGSRGEVTGGSHAQ